MGRKASDLVLLLGSRGKGRGRRRKSGVLGGLGHTLTRWIRGSSVAGKIGGPERRHMLVPGWLVVAIALLCFAGGFVAGDKFGPAPGGSGSDLHASLRDASERGRGPQKPGVIDETARLSSTAFVVAAYNQGSEEVTRARADRLSKFLREQGFAKARSYRPSAAKGSLWCVAIYFSGTDERKRTAEALRALPADLPFPVFVSYRRQGKKEWPQVYRVQ